ncbi:MAG: hypothetical protein CMJ64_04635 [Planctomycetaceae bacterium]|nr:hypothetical protein [Planctomycetaceae bacterium]
MKFEVEWVPAAEQQLADIWLAAEERDLVRRLSAEIDRSLSSDPMSVGESRESDEIRVAISDSFTVRFQVLPVQQHVVVFAIWLRGKRR